MITLLTKVFNILTQESYDSRILNFLQLEIQTTDCPKCRFIGSLKIHAYYCRYYGDENPIRLRILRVICHKCGSTHALLPQEIIAYKTTPMPILCQVLYDKLVKHHSYQSIYKDHQINPKTANRLVSHFRFEFEGLHHTVFGPLDTLMLLAPIDLVKFFNEVNLLYLVNKNRIHQLYYSVFPRSFSPPITP
jgi:transposase-like protein